MLVYGRTYTHKSVKLNSWLHPLPKGRLPSQLPHTFLSAPRGPVPLCTSLAPPTVYFQQLRFGPCHPCTRQPDLPGLCPLTASSVRCPPWRGTAKEHQAGGSDRRFTDTAGGYRPSSTAGGLHITSDTRLAHLTWSAIKLSCSNSVWPLTKSTVITKPVSRALL